VLRGVSAHARARATADAARAARGERHCGLVLGRGRRQREACHGAGADQRDAGALGGLAGAPRGVELAQARKERALQRATFDDPAEARRLGGAGVCGRPCGLARVEAHEARPERVPDLHRVEARRRARHVRARAPRADAREQALRRGRDCECPEVWSARGRVGGRRRLRRLRLEHGHARAAQRRRAREAQR
jgi:hypothetical protein